jgi:hypothetical protein
MRGTCPCLGTPASDKWRTKGSFREYNKTLGPTKGAEFVWKLIDISLNGTPLWVMDQSRIIIKLFLDIYIYKGVVTDGLEGIRKTAVFA